MDEEVKDFNISIAVLDDPRPESEKLNDWDHEEMAGAVILNWVKKPKAQWKTYSTRNQKMSSSCVGQSLSKAGEILDPLHHVYSAHPIYRRRANFPTPGMYLQNGGDIFKNQGTTTEALDQSQNLNEAEMNRDVTVETPTKIFGYVPNIDFRNIDKVAEAIETQGHCVLIFHSSAQEYLREKPVYDATKPIDIGHCICATDYFLDDTGEKVILIEDSSGLNSTIDKKGLRLISAEFLQKRFSAAMYLIPFTVALEEKPKWTFKKPLAYGMRVEQDVAAMQNILKHEGLFPLTSPSSGNYLDVTAKAVMAFQRKHKVAAEEEIVQLKGRTVGPKTRAKLNELYSG